MQLPTKKVVITRVISDPTHFSTFPTLIRLIFINLRLFFNHEFNELHLFYQQANDGNNS